MSRDRTLKGTPAALRVRQALEIGGTLAKMASLVLKAPGTIGNNLSYCGPREAMVLELSAPRGVVWRPRRGCSLLAIIIKVLRCRAWKGLFCPGFPFLPGDPNHFTETYCRARNERLRKLALGRRLGLAEIQAILADNQIANAGTAVCTVFSPAGRTLWAARGKKAPVNHDSFAEVTLWD